MAENRASECFKEQCETPELLFTGYTRFDDRQRYYIVVALSQRKQSKIMEGIGRVHSHDQPFPTWTIVGQALSKALFNQPECLRLKSTMDLHQKDYLLFEHASDRESMSIPPTTTAAECILEVDFGTQLDDRTWLGYWKTSRRVVAALVRNSTALNSILHHLLLIRR